MMVNISGKPGTKVQIYDPWKYIDARLLEWARWVSGSPFASTSMLGRLISDGEWLDDDSGVREPTIDHRAEEMERLIVTMGQHRPEWRIAIIAKFIWAENMNDHQRARRAGIGKTTLNDRARSGKAWLLDQLDAWEFKPKGG